MPISSGEGSPGIIEEDAFNYPDRVEGCQVELDEFVPAPGQKRAPYARLVMHCDKHADCRKHRNITIRSTLGPFEPVSFLAAWYIMGDPGTDASAHIHNCRPSMADQRAWLETHGSSLF